MLINAYATHAQPPGLDFPHNLRASRNWRDPDLAEHLGGLQAYVRAPSGEESGDSEEALIGAVVDHVGRVRSHLAFEAEAEHFPKVTEWAVAANALLFFPDSTLRDPNFRVLYDPQHPGPDPDAYVPSFSQGERRKQRTMAAMQQAGFPVNGLLPASHNDPEVLPEAVSDVANRLCSLLVVAVRAESISEGAPLSIESLHSRLPRAFVALTAQERSFLASEAPDDQDVINSLWRYECVPVLLWALGIVGELEFPHRVCDVAKITGAVLLEDWDSLAVNRHLRPVGELLDEADLTYRLHWAVRDAELNGREPIPGVEPGVLMERRNALEWLLDHSLAWDDVTLPT